MWFLRDIKVLIIFLFLCRYFDVLWWFKLRFVRFVFYWFLVVLWVDGIDCDVIGSELVYLLWYFEFGWFVIDF